MRVSTDQVKVIRTVIDESNISIETLRDDLLDHLCCTVEIIMEHGKDFNTALEEAIRDLAPHGLEEIQLETVFLLNSKNIIRMKKVMYSVGLISSVSISVGFLMKLLHLTGANEITSFGLLTFGFLFIPMVAINHFGMAIKRALSEKLGTILGLISGLIISLGITFKILHLFLADELLIIGFAIFSFGFLPFLFFNMYRKSIS